MSEDTNLIDPMTVYKCKRWESRGPLNGHIELIQFMAGERVYDGNHIKVVERIISGGVVSVTMTGNPIWSLATDEGEDVCVDEVGRRYDPFTTDKIVVHQNGNWAVNESLFEAIKECIGNRVVSMGSIAPAVAFEVVKGTGGVTQYGCAYGLGLKPLQYGTVINTVWRISRMRRAKEERRK